MKTRTSTFPREAEGAMNLIERHFGRRPGNWTETIEMIDTIVTTCTAKGKTDLEVGAFVLAMGSIIGEALISHHGGRWKPASKILESFVELRVTPRSSLQVDVFPLVGMRMGSRARTLVKDIQEIEKKLGVARASAAGARSSRTTGKSP